MAKKSKPKRKTQGGTYKNNQIAAKDTRKQPQSTFTLADEARQTSQHDHSIWNNETKLRSIPVSFLSAGLSEPLKEEQTSERTTEESLSSNTSPPTENNTHTAGMEEAANVQGQVTQKETDTANAAEADSLFYFDTGRVMTGETERNGRHHLAEMTPTKHTDSEQSDSEDEVILFKGRMNKTSPQQDTINLTNIRTEITAVEKEISQQTATADSKTPNEKPKTEKKTRGRRGGKLAKARRTVLEDEDDEMLADYIANMRDNGEMMHISGLACTPDASVDEDDSTATDNSDAEASSTDIPMEGALPSTMPKTQRPNADLISSVLEYTDFDPMDWERPSLRRKKGKGARKLDLRYADIDSETERRLQASWQNDRVKKAERKKEREQLRVLDLLGKNQDNDDLRTKYPKGMNIEQVADELKRFLVNFESSVCLPPMDKHARKMIHELANKFNVKSKSIGKADQRRPTLYRTKRTPRFEQAVFDQALSRVQRRYFPRLDYKGKGPSVQQSRNGYAEASYRDGEVVGGSAPELSTQNRGRAMLEKMGWSTGTALGSADNKGILLPVTQTMKRSKAGLG